MLFAILQYHSEYSPQLLTQCGLFSLLLLLVQGLPWDTSYFYCSDNHRGTSLLTTLPVRAAASWYYSEIKRKWNLFQRGTLFGFQDVTEFNKQLSHFTHRHFLSMARKYLLDDVRMESRPRTIVVSFFFSNFHIAVVFHLEIILPPRGICQYLETLLVVTIG